MPAKPIPPGYHAVTPYLTVRGAARAIDFYKRAFGATEQMRMPAADGERLMHAEIRIGDSVVMLSDEFPEMGGGRSPESLGGAGGSLFLYVDDVDATFRQAVAAGGKALMPVQDMFWGDRFGRVADPFGHVWGIATHTEDLTPEEIGRRAAAERGQA
ncbi:MAG: VOC family protein [Deltaproteobacteria bacterium]|nr:MAG: VOC family protein [Deltaproteobacteria bacterium]